jgi:hypothetical protein
MRSARVEQARLATELESLGREVDPHFLFNNLNALAHLVDQRRRGGVPFIRRLSASYRYVLECRGQALVPLADGARRARAAPGLADIRYCGGVRLAVDVGAADARHCPCLPFRWRSSSECAEAQHHRARPSPQIRVRVDDTTLSSRNELRPGPRPARSTGIGLAQPARAISHRHGTSGRLERRGGPLRRTAAARPQWARVLAAVTAACLQ